MIRQEHLEHNVKFWSLKSQFHLTNGRWDIIDLHKCVIFDHNRFLTSTDHQPSIIHVVLRDRILVFESRMGANATFMKILTYYSVQNKGTDCCNLMLPINYICRMSTRSSFSIFRSMSCLATLITDKKSNPLRSQAEEYQTLLIYLANRSSIPIWYQKHLLGPTLINLTPKEWMKIIIKFILWEVCLCQYYILVNNVMS